MGKYGGGANQGGSNGDMASTNSPFDDLSRLRSEFEIHRDFAEKEISTLSKEMPNKADKLELLDLESKLFSQLKEMVL